MKHDHWFSIWRIKSQLPLVTLSVRLYMCFVTNASLFYPILLDIGYSLDIENKEPLKMRTWKQVQISKFLRIFLTVVIVSGICLLFMVHQLENPPYIAKEFPFPKTPYFENANKRVKRSDILKNKKDSSFKDLYNFHTITLQQMSDISQVPSKRRYKFRKGNRLKKSGRVSNQTKKKFGPGSLLDKTVNVSHFHFQRGLPNGIRSFPDDYHRISESELALKRTSEMVKTSIPNPKAGTFKQHSTNAQTNIMGKREADSRKDSETTKVGFEYTKSVESDAEIRRPNNDANSQLSANVRYENLTAVNNVGHNVSQIRDRAITAKPNSRSAVYMWKNGANPSKPTAKISPSDTLESTWNHIQKEIIRRLPNEAVQEYELKQKTTNDLQDFDDDQKEKTFEEILNKEISIYQDFNQRPSEETPVNLINHGKKTSKVVSNFEGNFAPKVASKLRASDQHPKKKRRSLLIFGDDRSGTTFVTKMFSADPQMFTVYEPLWVTKKWFNQLGIVDPRDKDIVVQDVVNGLLSCHFTQSQIARSFLANTHPSWIAKGVFEKNVFRTSAFAARTKSGKKFWPDLYKYPKFAEQVCLNKFNHSVVKVGQVRTPRESIFTFISSIFDETVDTDVRVIQIVRDPRGSINSRIRSGWISDFTYTGFPTSVSSLCGKIATNIKIGRKLHSVESLRNRYMEIRYKEIATMPVATAKKIYQFAGFEMPDSLIDWIVRSTNPEQKQLAAALENPYSHVRDSSANYLKWRRESPIKRVRIIEQQCKTLLDLLGLDAVADEMETLRS